MKVSELIAVLESYSEDLEVNGGAVLEIINGDPAAGQLKHIPWSRLPWWGGNLAADKKETI